MEELIKHIQGAVNEQEIILPNAWEVAHFSELTLGVWFYSTDSRLLDYSETATGHADVGSFKTYQEHKDENWIRGRLIRKDNLNFLIVYKKLPIDQLHDLKSKVETASQKGIDYVVGFEGYDLLREQKQRENNVQI
jgi:hypothetical protein